MGTLSGPGIPPETISARVAMEPILGHKQTVPAESVVEPNTTPSEPGLFGGDEDILGFNEVIVGKLEQVIKDYRHGDFTKFSALSQVMKFLLEHPTGSNREKEQVFESYASIIDIIAQQKYEAFKQGEHATGGNHNQSYSQE